MLQFVPGTQARKNNSIFLDTTYSKAIGEGEKCIAILGCIWKAQLLHDKAEQGFITALQFFDAPALLSL
jgi:hypothetical protein